MEVRIGGRPETGPIAALIHSRGMLLAAASFAPTGHDVAIAGAASPARLGRLVLCQPVWRLDTHTAPGLHSRRKNAVRICRILRGYKFARQSVNARPGNRDAR